VSPIHIRVYFIVTLDMVAGTRMQRVTDAAWHAPESDARIISEFEYYKERNLCGAVTLLYRQRHKSNNYTLLRLHKICVLPATVRCRPSLLRTWRMF